MEKYGWDEYKGEGIAELGRMISSIFFAGKDELIYLLKKYRELYEADLYHQVKATTFYPDLEEKAARDKASNQIKQLRQNIEDFYNTEEGKKSGYRIYFVAKSRDYRLGIRLAGYEGEERVNPSDLIEYKEKKYFDVNYKPVFFKMNLLILAPTVAVLFIAVTAFTVAAGAYRYVYFYLGLLAFAITMAVGIIEISLIRLPEKKFVSLMGIYFLKLSNRRLSLASYSATCPICQGVIKLRYSMIGHGGYVGKCSENPDQHIFTFDHKKLSGHKR